MRNVNTYRHLLPSAVLLLAAGLAAWWWRRSPPQEESPPPPVSLFQGRRVTDEVAQQIARLEARENQLAATLWSREMLAQKCGRTLEDWWDTLNQATNKLALAATLPVGEVQLGTWEQLPPLPHAILHWKSHANGERLPAAQWPSFVEKFVNGGWALENVELRHAQFDTDAAGAPRSSRFYFAARLTNPRLPGRATIEGDLLVDWEPPSAERDDIAVRRIDASQLVLKSRDGEPPFELLLEERVQPPRNSNFIDPLMVYDFDGDGFPEIILAVKNLVYRRQPDGHYRSEALLKHPPGLFTTALIADFDGDGAADFLCFTLEGLVLFHGSRAGTFDQPGESAWKAPTEAQYPYMMTCGDIDADGDLDVFVGEYKSPYDNGQMPTPYFDANDGFPAYLLLNDSHGRFTDATQSSGLALKRWRRTYSASFADLDADSDLDLVVISDFAGADLYRNDGRGHFTDITRERLDEPHAFGMAHALADFNADGRLDLLMVGMPSPTADRLEHAGLFRPDGSQDREMRRRMTFGNRLFEARADGGFQMAPAAPSIARTGWTWGCSAFDFDNDGFPDLYFANGMDSKQTVRDYEGEYWLHDAYVGSSQNNQAVEVYLKTKVARLRAHGESYGGYEKNRLYLNRGGSGFEEIGHLFGVALEDDSRNVVATDLDGDGLVDLAVTSFAPWPQTNQLLRVYRNRLADAGNWTGFRLGEETPGCSPIGASATVHYAGHKATRLIVTGDSHRSQHTATLHFGIGKADRLDRVEIRWPDGRSVTVGAPAVNRYHFIHAPQKNPSAARE